MIAISQVKFSKRPVTKIGRFLLHDVSFGFVPYLKYIGHA